MSLNTAEAFAPLGADVVHLAASRHPAEDGWRPIMPVPVEAPEVTKELLFRAIPSGAKNSGFTFTDAWAYRDAENRVLGYVVRVDRLRDGAAAEKQIFPVTFCEGPNGIRRFHPKGFPEPRPLYGAHHLAARPSDPVMVFEGEKTAKAGWDLFKGHVGVTSPSGSKAAHKADWSGLKGREVVIMPDNDTPGSAYAAAVAELAYAAGARSVRIVELPDGLPLGWDVADPLPEGMTWANIQASVANAATVARPTSEGPLPLFSPLPPAETFPLPTLGPLAAVAAAIARKVQVPPAIAAQSVLAAASLAAQAHADVKLPFGQARPLSLFLVTVAGSGERKSTADNEALWPIVKHEMNLREINAEEMKVWRIAHAAWSAEKRKIEGAKGDYSSRKEQLTILGDEPVKPLAPFLVTGDMTPDGLTKNWPDAHAALGIFSAEGGTFTGSHGMSDDNRLRTAAMLSELWDGKPIKRVRAGDGISILPGRRLAMHIMVQPDAAAGFLADPTLRDQGLLSRALVSAPTSIAGTRLYCDPDPQDDSAIRSYGARLLSLLETNVAMGEGKRNELAPRVLTITPEAVDLWKGFFNSVEAQLGHEEDLRGIQDFAAKAAEHAARIAGVLTIYDDARATEIGPHMMGCALDMMGYYVGEALRLHGAGRTDPKLLTAHRLLEWLQALGTEPVAFRDILRLGPASARTKDAAEAALTTLKAHGWIEEVSSRPRSIRLTTGG